MATSGWLARAGLVAFDFTPAANVVGGECLFWLGSGDTLADGFNVTLAADRKLVVRIKGANYTSDVAVTHAIGVSSRFCIIWDGKQIQIYQDITRIVGNATSVTPNPVGMILTAIPATAYLGAAPAGALTVPGAISAAVYPTNVALNNDRWKLTTIVVGLLTAPLGAWLRITASATGAGWDLPVADGIVVAKDGTSVTVQAQPELHRILPASNISMESLLTGNANNGVVRWDAASGFGWRGTADYDDAVSPAERTRTYQGVPS